MTAGQATQRVVEFSPGPVMPSQEVAPRAHSRPERRGMCVRDVAPICDRPAAWNFKRDPVAEDHRDRERTVAEVGIVRSNHRARISNHQRDAIRLMAAGDDLGLGLRPRVRGTADADRAVRTEQISAREHGYLAGYVDD